ncbi:MAG: hypothetical protein IKB21_01085 [Clostridia bacterium]|nr:hypothetical protein [Clostridia bacterium]
MKHSIEELYSLRNGNHRSLMTKEYCKANGIIIATDRAVWKACQKSGAIYAMPAHSHNNNNKPVKVLDVNGIKLIYLFGEKTYFDTQEELDSYREVFHKEQAKEREINKLKKELLAKVEGMSAEELKKIIEKI